MQKQRDFVQVHCQSRNFCSWWDIWQCLEIMFFGTTKEMLLTSSGNKPGFHVLLRHRIHNPSSAQSYLVLGYHVLGVRREEGAWRDEPALKSSFCLCRGLEFSLQHPHLAAHNCLQLLLQRVQNLWPLWIPELRFTYPLPICNFEWNKSLKIEEWGSLIEVGRKCMERILYVYKMQRNKLERKNKIKINHIKLLPSLI